MVVVVVVVVVVVLGIDYFIPHTSLSWPLQLITLLKCLQLVFPSSPPPPLNPIPPTPLLQVDAVVAHAVDQKNAHHHTAHDAVQNAHALAQSL